MSRQNGFLLKPYRFQDCTLAQQKAANYFISLLKELESLSCNGQIITHLEKGSPGKIEWRPIIDLKELPLFPDSSQT